MHLFNAAVLSPYLKDMRDTIEYVFFVVFKSSRFIMLIYIIKIHS